MTTKTIEAPDTVSVAATPAAVAIPVPGRDYTLRNLDTANSIYYIQRPGTYVEGSTSFAGAAAVLRAAGGSEIKAGEAHVIRDCPPWIHVVCATGLTATLQIECGAVIMPVTVYANLGNVGLLDSAEAEVDPAIKSEQILLTGSNLTFSGVSLITAGAATTELLAKTASQTQRLHALHITVSTAALVEIEDKDNGVLRTWNFGANGGIVIRFDANPEGAIQQTVVNKGLQIVNSAGNLGGGAIVSTGV